jgi:hypothetical protein
MEVVVVDSNKHRGPLGGWPWRWWWWWTTTNHTEHSPQRYRG